MTFQNVIGIVGGMGPYAGLDLARKIMDQTPARRDQDHVPVALLSYPHYLPDRSAYLSGLSTQNPGIVMAQLLLQLEAAGATVAGIPCNTAHIAPIFDRMLSDLAAAGSRVRVLHIIQETVRYAQQTLPEGAQVGVLSTSAVYDFGLYRNALRAAGFTPLLPERDIQESCVQAAIFDKTVGIKARSHPVTPEATAWLERAVRHLAARGATAVVLGCTELPLALPQPDLDGCRLLDPTWILARALLHAVRPALATAAPG